VGRLVFAPAEEDEVEEKRRGGREESEEGKRAEVSAGE